MTKYVILKETGHLTTKTKGTTTTRTIPLPPQKKNWVILPKNKNLRLTLTEFIVSPSKEMEKNSNLYQYRNN